MNKTKQHTRIKDAQYHTDVDFTFDKILEELQQDTPIQMRVSNVLRMTVHHVQASRAAVFQVHDGAVLPRRFRWPLNPLLTKSDYQLDRRNTLTALGLAHWESPLSNGNILSGNTKDTNAKEQEFLMRDGGKSYIVLPIIVSIYGWWGFLEITDIRNERTWTQETKDLLQAIAQEIGKTVYDDELSTTMNMSKADLVELRLREELLSAELDEINRWKNQILSAFSHEFQTPLYTLLGFSKTLLENEELDDDKEIRMTCLQHIYDQSRRLEKLVNNMMFASRLHTKSLQAEKRQIDFQSILSAVQAWAEPKAQTQGLDFQTELPDGKLPVTCDASKIERMLQNILDNAFTNTPSPGWVSMKVFPDSHNIVIIVADTGSGISKDQINRIFEPFYSINPAQTAESGIGLGLSIAKEIVDLHNGFITVESKEGEGSVFTITLPRNNKESILTLQ